MSNEINITLFHPPTSKTDAISIPPSTTLSDLSNFAMALLGLDGDIILAKVHLGMTMPIYNPSTAAAATAGGDNTNNAIAATEGFKTLGQCGITDGEFISVYRVGEFERTTNSSAGQLQQQQQQQRRQISGRVTAPAAAAASNNNANAGGGLDFSSLFGAAAAAPQPATTTNNGNTMAMDFTALLSSSAATTTSATTANTNNNGSSTTSSTPTPSTQQQQPVQWDGMNLDQAMSSNPNPIHLMTILSNTTRHPNLLKELNYHHPQVCKKLMAVVPNNDIHKMAEIWRQTMMKTSMSRFLQNHSKKSKEIEMRNKLHLDPMNAEANKYFGEKIRLENVHRQYEQMMEEYPESMGRVLMLYMNCLVNKKPLQVFVDSGAQMTIMSSVCADRLGLLHLVDDRFAGVAVGVGTGKILGKVHIVELEIGGYAFPCSITVMDSKEGLGDKNMDCLFGLDMLKRHRCSIDLAKNVLRFTLGHGGGAGGETMMEAPFLHEKDLPTSKGGTMGFDADSENAKIEARLDKMETEDEDGGNDGDGDDGKKSKAQENGET